MAIKQTKIINLLLSQQPALTPDYYVLSTFFAFLYFLSSVKALSLTLLTIILKTFTTRSGFRVKFQTKLMSCSLPWYYICLFVLFSIS